MRKIVALTGTRADYGLMRPVYRAIAAQPQLDLHLIVTGMHLLPEFASSLAEVRGDNFATLSEASMILGEDSGKAMAQSIGLGTFAIAEHLGRLQPDIVMLPGDRSEILAGAIAAAHMNICAVHISGGDSSGTIDDSVRHATSKLSHFHLTTSDASTRRLIAMGEQPDRIVFVGEPGLDVLREMQFIPLSELAAEYGLDPARPIILATLHPVTDEAEQGAGQMQVTLHALSRLGHQVVFTYPNSDAGGRAMRDVLESWRGHDFLRIVPNLGSARYLSLMKAAALVLGNSSSAFLEAPSLSVAAVNIGTRQQSRERSENIIDADFDADQIVAAVNRALHDTAFREGLKACRNPYGDGHAAERIVDVLLHLRLDAGTTAKWLPSSGPYLCRST
ncbi:MAG: UDP-N-acetylglucosamine 2-epimerase (hydrolyzing) [Rhodopseudomonas palustris]|uniref:UDP-N-acetylglucosamine 2-epimerase (Hydrolyzing) n=1 Tax=Rhodopseudomonas palustris TaxID=1076 RepID=A0A933S4S2_RHOPL|nr:UDP-N-acetylglucosamine 2-epimerase (hydrolyzing) [Rhodopseudomonas palustris]